MRTVRQLHYHADDYGLNPQTAERIRHCWEQGCLDGVSIFPNGCLQETLPQLDWDRVQVSVHINLVEGRPVSSPSGIPLLVDERGYFRHSFTGLLRLSVSGQKKELELQLRREIRAQLEKMKEILPPGRKMGLDSHQHTHMIPLVMKCLLTEVGEMDFPADYLRVANEPLLPFVLQPSLYGTYSPVNLVKNLLLKCLAWIDGPMIRKSGLKTAVFFGLMFSGEMDGARVARILPGMKRIAQRKKQSVEVLFHPGYVEQGELLPDPEKTGFVTFHLSEGRRREYDALHALKRE